MLSLLVYNIEQCEAIFRELDMYIYIDTHAYIMSTGQPALEGETG